MNCNYCGGKLRKNANFCPKCGKAVGTENTPYEPTEPLYGYEKPQFGYEDPAYDYEEEEEYDRIQESGRDTPGGIQKVLIIIAIALGSVVLAAGIVLVVLLARTGGTDSQLDSGRQLLTQGIVAYQSGDYETAEENFTRAVEEFQAAGETDSDDFTTAVIGAADSQAEQGDYEGAKEIIRTFQPDLPEDVYLQANQDYDAGQPTRYTITAATPTPKTASSGSGKKDNSSDTSRTANDSSNAGQTAEPVVTDPNEAPEDHNEDHNEAPDEDPDDDSDEDSDDDSDEDSDEDSGEDHGEETIEEPPTDPDDPNWDGSSYASTYQPVLDAYTDRLQNGGWGQDIDNSENGLVSWAIDYECSNDPDSADDLYFALADVGGTGTPVLLIAMGDTCVDAFSVLGRIFDNCGGGGSRNFIEVMDTGTLYCNPMPAAGGCRDAKLCSVDANGQVTLLDNWGRDGNMAMTYWHNGVEYPFETFTEIDDIVDTYGSEAAIDWTPLTAGCQVLDAPVQTVYATHTFNGSGTDDDNTGTGGGDSEYGPDVDVVPTDSQMVDPYWVKCNGDERIRSGPGQNYDGITLLPEANLCEMLVLATCEVNDPTLTDGTTWGFVQYFDNGGGYGWCYLGYTKVISGSANEALVDDDDDNGPITDGDTGYTYYDDTADDAIIGDTDTDEEDNGVFDSNEEFRVSAGKPDWSDGDLPDWQGHRLMAVSITGTSYPVTYELSYDGDSVLPSEMIKCASDGTVDGDYYYTYDSQDRLVLEELYMSGIHDIDPVLREFNSDGQLTMDQYTEGSMAEYDYEYDAEGKAVSCVMKADGMVSYIDYLYDSDGSLSEVDTASYYYEGTYEDGRYRIVSLGDLMGEDTQSYSGSHDTASFDGIYRYNYPYVEICDAAGYTAAEIWLGGGTSWSCTYDSDGYLTEIVCEDGTTASFIYE